VKTRSPIACALLPEWPIAVLHSDLASRDLASSDLASSDLASSDLASSDLASSHLQRRLLEQQRHRTPTPARAEQAARSVHRGQGSAARLLYCDAYCGHVGLRPGQSLASARARYPELSSVPYDAERLVEAQRSLIAELLEVSPRVESAAAAMTSRHKRRASRPWNSAPPMRLWLDVGQHWRDAAPHALTLAQRLRAHAPYALGVGPTACVAYAAALAAMSQRPRIISPEEAQTFLDASPLGVLEFDADDLSTLAALGLRRVGELRAFSPAALASRLSPGARIALDRAWGHDARGPHTPRPEDELSVRVALDDELTHTQALLFLLTPALGRLATELRARGLGVTRLELQLEGTRGTTLSVSLASASAEASVLLELLRTRLDALQLRSPVRAFRLSCANVVSLRPATRSLFEQGPGRDPGAREVALGRLRERHGDGAVHRASREESPHLLARARWVLEGEPSRGEAMPWRRLSPPVPVQNGAVTLLGQRRMLLRVGRCERAGSPFWEAGHARVELFAWAELEGPLLALLRGDVNDACEDRWEVVAWVD